MRNILSRAVHLAFLLFLGAMAYAVFALGETFNQPLPYRVLVAAACALGILGHGAAATRDDGSATNAARMMHGIALGVWLVLSVFLASVYMFVSSDQLRAVLPKVMADLGAWVYALAFGVGLFTSTLALVVPSVAARPIVDAMHGSIGAAVQKYGEPLLITLAVAASSLHLWSFGMNVATPGDMFSAAAAMVIADLAFLVSEKRVVTELKARRAGGRHDTFDLMAWGIFGLAVLAYLVLVNVYSIRYSAGTLDRSDPMFLRVVDFYAASPSILVLCTAALALLTAFIDRPRGGDVIEGEARPTLRKPVGVRAAGFIRGQREAWGDAAQALRGDRAQVVKPDHQLAGKDAASITETAAETAEELPTETGRKPAKNRTVSGADGAARPPKSGGENRAS
jgi:hypothetical protein